MNLNLLFSSRQILVILLPLLFLPSCDQSPVPPPPEPVLSWTYGRNDYTMEIDGHLREFIVSVPTGYDSTAAVPLVMMLHGTGGDGAKFYRESLWAEKGEMESFISVFPTGLTYTLADGTVTTKWGAGGLINELPPGDSVVDDIPFMHALLDELEHSFLIDSDRLFITGFSNGGGFVKSEVLPRMGDRFAAASSCGGAGIPEITPIVSDRIMPFFNISGTEDDKIKVKTGSQDELPIEGSDIRNHDLLWSGLTNLASMVGVDSTFRENPSQPVYNLLIFDNPVIPGGSELRFVMIKGMEHRYPNGSNNPRGVRAVELLWPWFEGIRL